MTPHPDPLDAPALRWGILGSGAIARKFADAVAHHTRSTVVAVAAASGIERAQGLADEKGIARAYGSYEALAADAEVDAVYVATTHNAHHGPALTAIAGGKHVLIEKAFTQNLAQARQVVDAAREAGVFLMEAMWTRHLPQMHLIREAIARGDIGEVRTFRGDHGHDHTGIGRLTDPDRAGGALLDLAVYPISMAVDLLGVPDAVHARGRLGPTGVDAEETVVLDYPDARASVTATMDALSPCAAYIGGTRGWIELDRVAYEPGVVRCRTEDAVVWEHDGSVENGFQFEIAEAARCIAAGLTESPVHPIDHTVAQMAIMDEVRRQIGVIYPNER